MQYFKSPSHRLKFLRMNNEEIFQRHALLNCFPFHSMHLLIPDAKVINEEENILTSKDDIYFICKDVTAAFLMGTEFIENFIKKGLTWAVTQYANAETENFLAILPSGKLVLSLEKEVAKCLSLEKKEYNKKKKKMKNFATYMIDMKSVSPSKNKQYEKLLFELAKIDHIKFTVCFKWMPSENTCLQSIKLYFETHGYECIVCEPKHWHSSKRFVPTPVMTPNAFEPDVCETVLEWIGAQICGVEFSESVDNYTSKFIAPEPASTTDSLYIDSWQGFFSEKEIFRLHQKIKEVFAKNPSVPFVALSAKGYQDCYMECLGFEHFSAADKLVCIIFFPSSECWVLTLNL